MAKKVILVEYFYYRWRCPDCDSFNEIECDNLLGEEVECENCDECYSFDIDD